MIASSICSNMTPLRSLLIFTAVALVAQTMTNAQEPADWMKGGFGIGVRFNSGSTHPTGCDSNLQGLSSCISYNPWLPTLNSERIANFVSQIISVDGVRWVTINLSQGAFGDQYMAPHSVLTNLDPGSTPPADGTDPFEMLATALQDAGLKVIAYMAAQGPAMLKHKGNKAYDRGEYSGNNLYNATCDCTPAMKRWEEYVNYATGASDYDALKNAYADIIVGEYAERYGDKIDGWWFDQATYANVTRINENVKAHNANAVTAYSEGTKIPLTNNNPGLEDYTFGHPIPIKRTPASDIANLGMLTSIEDTTDGYIVDDATGKKSLGHMYMPMCSKWNTIGSQNVWNVSQAADWQSRAMDAGGAWTWNIPRNNNLFQTLPGFELVDVDKIAFLQEVITLIYPSESPSASLAPTERPSGRLSISLPPSLYPSEILSGGPSISLSPSLSPSITPSITSSESPTIDDPSSNVALSSNGGVASQSVTFHEASASLAIDGNSNGDYHAGSTTHTLSGDNPSWWKVQLSTMYTISRVNVYNRNDCCGGRLVDFQVIIYRDTVQVYNSTVSAPRESSTRKVMYTFTIADIVGDKVEIILPSNGYLSLAEVEVLGNDI